MATLKAWAMKLRMPDVANLLDETLQQEKKADLLLSRIAETAVNAEGVL
jgi:ferritin-like metal-binding protein YciE